MEKMKDEMKDIEGNIEKCEEDIVTKDSQMRTLKEELAHQEELIQKLIRCGGHSASPTFKAGTVWET